MLTIIILFIAAIAAIFPSSKPLKYSGRFRSRFRPVSKWTTIILLGYSILQSIIGLIDNINTVDKAGKDPMTILNSNGASSIINKMILESLLESLLAYLLMITIGVLVHLTLSRFFRAPSTKNTSTQTHINKPQTHNSDSISSIPQRKHKNDPREDNATDKASHATCKNLNIRYDQFFRELSNICDKASETFTEQYALEAGEPIQDNASQASGRLMRKFILAYYGILFDRRVKELCLNQSQYEQEHAKIIKYFRESMGDISTEVAKNYLEKENSFDNLSHIIGNLRDNGTNIPASSYLKEADALLEEFL